MDGSDIMLMPSPVTHITGYGSGMVLPFVTPVKSALMSRWDADAAVAAANLTGCLDTCLPRLSQPTLSLLRIL